MSHRQHAAPMGRQGYIRATSVGRHDHFVSAISPSSRQVTSDTSLWPLSRSGSSGDEGRQTLPEPLMYLGGG
jgi:hypothetical protein